MTQGEKTLGMLVGLMLLGFMGLKILTGLVLEPARTLDAQIAAAKVELTKYNNALALKAEYVGEWTNMVGRTLGATEPETITRLNGELNRLLAKHRLDKFSIKPQGALRLGRSGVRIVRFGLSGDGDLSTIVGLLEEFYRLPYILRMRSLSLNPAAADPGRRFKMTASVETLLLPETQFANTVPASPDATEQAGPGRLPSWATSELYAGIHKRKL